MNKSFTWADLNRLHPTLINVAKTTTEALLLSLSSRAFFLVEIKGRSKINEENNIEIWLWWVSYGSL
jgi:hypothetical protein